jgi:hypothetical protein
MNQYLSVINYRTLIALTIAVITPMLAYKFNINYNIDLTLLSIAIIFPLVFTIRGSFRRREKALEHLSQFRSALKTLHYFFMSDKALSENDKIEITNILTAVSEKFMDHLIKNNYKTTELDKNIGKIHQYIDGKKELISRRLKDRLFRFMNDLHESVENLQAIHTHRTPISLKAYCKIFIYIFPFIYAPIIINNIGPDKAQWITYFIVILSEFILIALYNIQDQLEYPFDKEGLDDIKLDGFKFDR